MKIVILDDELLAIKRLQKSVMEAEPSAELCVFTSAEELFSYAKEHEIEVAFLDIMGLDMDGVTLAKKLKILNPRVNIIFSTGYSEYALDALEMYASGYLMKPITAEKVAKALSELRYPVQKKNSHLRLQCFGNFEVFVDGIPIHFKHGKTKELFAYLYDRKGALCTTGEILAVLWEDDNDHTSYLKQLRKDLFEILSQYEIDDIIVRQRGGISIRYDKIDSDLQDWNKGLVSGINAYQGEYMNQYSWAEVTAAYLSGKK